MREMELRERWRWVVGHEGQYQVSNLGRVRSVDREVWVESYRTTSGLVREGSLRKFKGQLLRPGPQQSGHVSVAIGKGNSRQVHQLVLEAFRGPCPEGHEGLHKNHNPGDNRLSNLKWGTRSENILMDYAAGVRKVHPNFVNATRNVPKGEANVNAKLTEGGVREIRNLVKQGQDYKAIASRYGVSGTAIRHIAIGRTWRHVR